MATSGTVYGVAAGGGRRPWVWWQRTGVEGGKSRLTFHVGSDPMSGYSTWGTFSGTLTVNGYAYSVSGGVSSGVSNTIWSQDTGLWTHPGGGALTLNISLTGRIAGVVGWTSTTLSGTGSVDATVAAPANPSGLVFARSGDRAGSLSWSAAARAEQYGVQLVYDSQSWAYKWWVTSRSKSVSGLQADSLVWVRVSAWNGSGYSPGFSNVVTFYTPPVSMPKPVLQVMADGVLVKATANKYPYGLEFKRSDGVTGSVGTGLSAVAPFQVLDTNLGGLELTYQVRTFAGPVEDRVYSPWSPASDPVTTLAPPFAATTVAPAGITGEGDVLFSWRHNPADGTEQTDARVQYRLVGAGAWTTVESPGSSLSKTIPLTQGMFEWQVCTKGLDADYGPYSAVRSFRVIAIPVVSITSPSGVWNRPQLAVDWVTGQAEDVPQSAWRAKLYHDGTLVEEKSGSGATSSTSFNTLADDGDTYSVEVQTATSGVWTNPDTALFDVEFVPPAAPLIQVLFDDETGAHMVTVTPGDTVAFTEPTVMLEICRSIDGGDTWEPVARNLAADEITVPDYQGLTNGQTQYRVTAYTEWMASASTTLMVDADSPLVWFGIGEGFATTTGNGYNPSLDVPPVRSGDSFVYFDGDSIPTLIEGDALSLQASGSFDLLPAHVNAVSFANRKKLQEFSVARGLALVRTPMGDRITGKLTVQQATTRVGAVTSVSWSVREAQ